MSIIIRTLPLILISIIFYVFVYNLYPQYKSVLDLTKRINELKNIEKELDLNLKLFQSLNQSPNIKQLLSNKKLLNAWLPLKPNVEEIVFFLDQTTQNLGLKLNSINFSVKEKGQSFNSNILPIIPVNVSFNGFFGDKILDLIKSIESSTRILIIKNINLEKDGKVNIEVESYYLSDKID